MLQRRQRREAGSGADHGPQPGRPQVAPGGSGRSDELRLAAAADPGRSGGGTRPQRRRRQRRPGGSAAAAGQQHNRSDEEWRR